MRLRLLRRIAIVLLAFYAFGQVGVALAACGMDRGAMAQAMTMPAGQGCDECPQPGRDTVSAACAAHCTADLQLTARTPDAVPASAIEARAVLAVPIFSSPPVVASLPPGTLPRRILLHSFQV